MKPTYHIRARWQHRSEPPTLKLGFWDFHIPIESRFEVTMVPFPPKGNNSLVYEIAKQFVALLILRDICFEPTFHQQKLYNDIREAQQSHYLHTRPVHAPAPRDDYWTNREEKDRKEKEELLSAEQRAQIFLREVNEDLFHNVQRGHAFYITSEEGEKFMIDPSNRNLVWLRHDTPVGLCVYLSDTAVQNNKWDWSIAMYLYIRGNLDHVKETANEYRQLRWGTSYTPLDDIKEKPWNQFSRPSEQESDSSSDVLEPLPSTFLLALA